jgi:hypothetical protein
LDISDGGDWFEWRAGCSSLFQGHFVNGFAVGERFARNALINLVEFDKMRRKLRN